MQSKLSRLRNEAPRAGHCAALLGIDAALETT